MDAVVVSGLDVTRGGRPVLQDLALSVPAGRVTGLLGPSGCGKSTLMRAIVGVQRVQGGDVTVLGLPAGAPELRRRVGYVTQAPSVYADLTAGENLRHFARIVAAPADDPARVMEIVGLSGRGDQPVGQMSGGERARVSLAVALLGSPDCWCSTSRRWASTRSCAATSGGPSTDWRRTAPPCWSRAT